MAYNLACWCIQMAYTQHSWMRMNIVVGLSVRLFVYGIFRWLCICWQITWNKWHKIWHDDVVIIGRWLLPSPVDTWDICCRYWQHILVLYKILSHRDVVIMCLENDFHHLSLAAIFLEVYNGKITNCVLIQEAIFNCLLSDMPDMNGKRIRNKAVDFRIQDFTELWGYWYFFK